MKFFVSFDGWRNFAQVARTSTICQSEYSIWVRWNLIKYIINDLYEFFYPNLLLSIYLSIYLSQFATFVIMSISIKLPSSPENQARETPNRECLPCFNLILRWDIVMLLGIFFFFFFFCTEHCILLISKRF